MYCKSCGQECVYCTGAVTEESAKEEEERAALVEQLTRALLAAEIPSSSAKWPRHPRWHRRCCGLSHGAHAANCIVDAALAAAGLKTQEERDAKRREHA